MLRCRCSALVTSICSAVCWELRPNLTFYDAAYVALAEALGATLPTGDRRLAEAPGPTCHVETLNPT